MAKAHPVRITLSEPEGAWHALQIYSISKKTRIKLFRLLLVGKDTKRIASILETFRNVLPRDVLDECVQVVVDRNSTGIAWELLRFHHEVDRRRLIEFLLENADRVYEAITHKSKIEFTTEEIAAFVEKILRVRPRSAVRELGAKHLLTRYSDLLSHERRDELREALSPQHKTELFGKT